MWEEGSVRGFVDIENVLVDNVIKLLPTGHILPPLEEEGIIRPKSAAPLFKLAQKLGTAEVLLGADELRLDRNLEVVVEDVVREVVQGADVVLVDDAFFGRLVSGLPLAHHGPSLEDHASLECLPCQSHDAAAWQVVNHPLMEGEAGVVVGGHVPDRAVTDALVLVVGGVAVRGGRGGSSNWKRRKGWATISIDNVARLDASKEDGSDGGVDDAEHGDDMNWFALFTKEQKVGALCALPLLR